MKQQATENDGVTCTCAGTVCRVQTEIKTRVARGVSYILFGVFCCGGGGGGVVDDAPPTVAKLEEMPTNRYSGPAEIVDGVLHCCQHKRRGPRAMRRERVPWPRGWRQCYNLPPSGQHFPLPPPRAFTVSSAPSLCVRGGLNQSRAAHGGTFHTKSGRLRNIFIFLRIFIQTLMNTHFCVIFSTNQKK